MILAAAVLAAWLPNSTLTPGVANKSVSQDNIKTTICKDGWAETIRPPPDYTESLKKIQLRQVRYKDKTPSKYEEDHLISLELGGDPKDTKNLWPQQYTGKCGARVKDKIEDHLHKLVCSGKVSLETARYAISSDWVKAYNQYLGKLSCGG